MGVGRAICVAVTAVVHDPMPVWPSTLVREASHLWYVGPHVRLGCLVAVHPDATALLSEHVARLRWPGSSGNVVEVNCVSLGEPLVFPEVVYLYLPAFIWLCSACAQPVFCRPSTSTHF